MLYYKYDTMRIVIWTERGGERERETWKYESRSGFPHSHTAWHFKHCTCSGCSCSGNGIRYRNHVRARNLANSCSLFLIWQPQITARVYGILFKVLNSHSHSTTRCESFLFQQHWTLPLLLLSEELVRAKRDTREKVKKMCMFAPAPCFWFVEPNGDVFSGGSSSSTSGSETEAPICLAILICFDILRSS